MVKLNGLRIERVIRRISSGDEGTPLEPPLTDQEKDLGGRLEDFLLVVAEGDDEYRYQWTFPPNTNKQTLKTSIQDWFKKGKGAVVAPMITAVSIKRAEEWDV